MQFCVDLDKQTVSTLGLLFDFVGTIFIASEVYKKCKGQEYIDPGDQCLSGPAKKTDEFLKWEKDKFLKMTIGLISVAVGFLLQIIANWI